MHFLDYFIKSRIMIVMGIARTADGYVCRIQALCYFLGYAFINVSHWMTPNNKRNHFLYFWGTSNFQFRTVLINSIQFIMKTLKFIRFQFRSNGHAAVWGKFNATNTKCNTVTSAVVKSLRSSTPSPQSSKWLLSRNFRRTSFVFIWTICLAHPSSA
jgi:hypothetical protein